MAKKSEYKKLQARAWAFSLKEDENDIPAAVERLKICGADLVFMIKHDKDKKTTEDGEVVPKEPHYHFYMHYENPADLATICKIFDIDPPHQGLIQKVYGKSSAGAVRYLTHLDDKMKYQYSIGEIEFIKGSLEDYTNIISGKKFMLENLDDIIPDFGKFDKVSYKAQFQTIFELDLPIKKQNELIKILKQAYDDYIMKREYDMIDRDISVIFVTGPSGSGKTTFAKQFCRKAEKTFCVSSSSNDVMQDYQLEDVLILDDLRDNAFSYADFLKLLDNHTSSTTKSRFRNKRFLGDTIFITSVVEPRDWYKMCEEDMKQFYRRISLYVECRQEGNSCVARIFVPESGKPAISDNGTPNKWAYQDMPIIQDLETVSNGAAKALAKLGIDASQIEPPNRFEQLTIGVKPQ